MQEIIVNRCNYVYQFGDPVDNYCLHRFSDSSLAAYAICIYLKSVSGSENICVIFVTAKSRAVPLKKSFTIPRLELLGNFILSKLMVTVHDSLVSEIDISNFYCWTDLQTSLTWIRATNQEIKTFVENWVNTIRILVAPKLWNYCKTDVNSADIVTRISKHNFIENNLWCEGPLFLKNASIENNFSRSNSNTKLEIGDSLSQVFQEEIKISSNANLLTCENVNSIQNIIDIEKFSSYKKLLRLTSWVFRFVRNITKKKDKNLLPCISADEFEEAKSLWLRVNQLDLCLHLDDNGLYRSTGRLSQEKPLPCSITKPILLNRNHKLTRLIVLGPRERIQRSGERHTLTEVRNQYWIPRGKSFIKKILNKCVTCRKLN